MGKNWLFNSIFGSDEPTPTRPIPQIPIVDDAPPLSVTKRSPETDRLIYKFQTESAIRAIFGDTLSLAKNPADSSGEPSTTTYNSPTHFSLPEPVADPRRRQCNCPCTFCQSGSGCCNCDATPRCEFSALDVLSEILPVDPEEETKLRAAAMSRQQARIATSRIAKHRHGLAPFIAKFKSDLRPYSTRVSASLWDRLLDSAAAYCADAVAAT